MKNYARFFFLFLVAFLSLTLLAACSVAGVNSPITVEGVEVQVSSVKLQDSYSASGNQNVRPTSASDTLLIANLAVKSPVDKLGWAGVQVVDETGRKSNPYLTTSISKENKVTEIGWVFAVSKTAKSLTLQLPGNNTINLDSYITK